MSETRESGKAGAGRPRSGKASGALAPDAVPPPTGVDGLPSIATIINDPKAQAEVLARLQGRSPPPAKKGGAGRGGRIALASIGLAAVLAAAAYGYRTWRDRGAGAPATSVAALPTAPAPAPVAPPPAVTPVAIPSPPAAAPPPPAAAPPPAVAPPAEVSSPRPVTTTPVQLDTAEAAGRPSMSEEWLRAHEALGLPPPKLVKTIRIDPPKSE